MSFNLSILNSDSSLQCVISQITGLVIVLVAYMCICCMTQALMNERFTLTAMQEASDGWACFGLITCFTRDPRIAVYQGPHYKSCRLSRASSHPHLMSQRSCHFAVFWPRGILSVVLHFIARLSKSVFFFFFNFQYPTINLKKVKFSYCCIMHSPCWLWCHA